MNQKIAVIGLGYVGLPLAMAFGIKFETAGFDESERLVNKCRSGEDPHGDLAVGDFERADKLAFSASRSGGYRPVAALESEIQDAKSMTRNNRRLFRNS